MPDNLFDWTVSDNARFNTINPSSSIAVIITACHALLKPLTPEGVGEQSF